VIVNPETAQGWLEPLAMDTARARLVEAIRQHDPHRRFRLYQPFTAGGRGNLRPRQGARRRRSVLRVGSSNFNNRSMRLDTECDVAIEASGPEDRLAIARIRDDLIGEHLGVGPERFAAEFAQRGSLIDAIEALRGPGRTLRDYVTPDLTAIEAWLAENEVLDPENPEDMFEPMRGKLLKGVRRTNRRRAKLR
jgi:phosphatidylserine/phosphatidylglycerophosphate/cardiolipin synthase-like enzyme